jgi:hypothetical protein
MSTSTNDPRNDYRYDPWRVWATCELDAEGHEISICVRCEKEFKDYDDFFQHALECQIDESPVVGERMAKT